MRKLYWDLNNKLDVRKAWGKKNLKVAETCFIKKEGRKKKKKSLSSMFPYIPRRKENIFKKIRKKKRKEKRE
jgi:hypothetical protein